MHLKILTFQNKKLLMSERQRFLNAGLTFLPYNLGGYGNVCPNSTKGCRNSCLNKSGFGLYPKCQEARRRRIHLWKENPAQFFSFIKSDIESLERKAALLGKNTRVCIRLNVCSDIVWEKEEEMLKIISYFPSCVFYDYTKNPKRGFGWILPNYHLCFSRSENNEVDCKRILIAGGNVAVVFRKKEKIPDTFWGYKVIKPKDDLRFLDPPQSIVGLHAVNMRAKFDKSGFVV